MSLPLLEASPEARMDFVAVSPLAYELAPGQGLVVVTSTGGDGWN